MNDRLSKIARKLTESLGTPLAILACTMLMVAWIAWAATLHFNDVSQLALSSITSVVTTIMTFLILHSQNKDSKAGSLKLDEVIRALDGADNRFRRLEAAPDATLNELACQVDDETCAN